MRVLLVDDEFFVRDRIRNQIDWAALGVREVREADNGVQALRLAEQWEPNILISDVRMPQLDGLALAERMSALSPDCRVIFISGYADKPALHNAIRLHAVSFIEKPIQIEEVREAVASAVKSLREQREISRSMNALRHANRERQTAEAARELINPSPSTVNRGVRLLAEHIDVSQYYHITTILVRVESRDVSPSSASGSSSAPMDGVDERGNMESRVAAFLETALNPDEAVVIGFMAGDVYAAHLFTRVPMIRWRETVAGCCQKLLRFLNENGADASVAVGQPVTSIRQLGESYRTAKRAMDHCFYKPPGAVCFSAHSIARAYDLRAVQLEDYQRALKNETPDELLTLIHDLTATLRQYEATPPAAVMRLFNAIIGLMMHAAEQDHIQLFDQFEDSYAVYQHIRQLRRLDELYDLAREAVRRYDHKINAGTNNAVVNRIIRYIRGNYQNPDLSVTLIADTLKLSPTYVCHLFKNVTGQTLVAYLTDVRLNEALALMNAGETRVKVIAERVGYRSSNYFSYQFKRRMGYTPSRPEP
ncbi:MAG: response regulator [Oscillospiraceae bacterium]|jgi:two-component system response regulator YesN|nr:response regulator [Oscillospiraceae bacterium]